MIIIVRKGYLQIGEPYSIYSYTMGDLRNRLDVRLVTNSKFYI